MTNTMNTDTSAAVAVLGLPDLARVLSGAGLQVVTGEPFRAAAVAVNAHLKRAPLALIFADMITVGTQPWVDKVVRSCPAVFVEVALAPGQSRIAGATSSSARVASPVSVDQLLAAVGLAPRCPGALLLPDGSIVAGAPEPEPAPLPAYVPPARVEPVYVAPVAVVQVNDEDSWGLDEPGFVPSEPAPPPRFVPPVQTEQAPSPAPVSADFWSKAPARRVRVQEPVTPPTYQAPQYQQPVAPVAYQAPVTPAHHQQPEPPPYRSPIQVEQPATPVDYQQPPATPPQYQQPAAQVAYQPPAPVQPAIYSQPGAPLAYQVPGPASFTQPRPEPVVVERIGVETTFSAELGRTLAPVVFTLAGKGGVGKTSLALALAQRAAVVGGLRTVLIDANRGQGDLRIYLGLKQSGLPTVYDAAVSGDPSTAIITPDRLNANRTPDSERLGIALVQAPPAGMADPESITAGLYHDVITAARGISDLVVIDTQIVEGAERGLFDELIIPMLGAHAFGLGIADLSKPGVDNLVTHLREFIERGVPVNRLMTMMNRVPDTTEFNLQMTSDALSQYGIFQGCVAADADLHKAMAYGTSIQDNAILAPVLDAVLMRVTGNPVFAHVATPPVQTKKRGGFFRRNRG